MKGMPVAHNSPHISDAGTVISEGLVLNEWLYFLFRSFVSHLRRSINRGLGESATKGIKILKVQSKI